MIACPRWTWSAVMVSRVLVVKNAWNRCVSNRVGWDSFFAFIRAAPAGSRPRPCADAGQRPRERTYRWTPWPAARSGRGPRSTRTRRPASSGRGLRLKSVIDIHEHQPAVGSARDGRSFTGEVHQEPGGDGVELADVSGGERSEERPQRRGGVDRGEDLLHPAVAQQRHVIDRIRPRDHPRHQRRHLQPGIRALIRPGRSTTDRRGSGGPPSRRDGRSGPDQHSTRDSGHQMMRQPSVRREKLAPARCLSFRVQLLRSKNNYP